MGDSGNHRIDNIVQLFTDNFAANNIVAFVAVMCAIAAIAPKIPLRWKKVFLILLCVTELFAPAYILVSVGREGFVSAPAFFAAIITLIIGSPGNIIFIVMLFKLKAIRNTIYFGLLAIPLIILNWICLHVLYDAFIR